MKKVWSTLLLFFCLCASFRLGAEVFDHLHNKTFTKTCLSKSLALAKKTEPRKKRNLSKPPQTPFIFEKKLSGFSPIFQKVLLSREIFNERKVSTLGLLRSPPSALV